MKAIRTLIACSIALLPAVDSVSAAPYSQAYALRASIPRADIPRADTTRITARTLDRMSEKAVVVGNSIEKCSDGYLRKMAKQESRLKAKLWALDSAKAKTLFKGVEEKYATLMSGKSIPAAPGGQGPYIPAIDSLRGILSFISKNPRLAESGGAIGERLQQVDQLQARLQRAQEIDDFLKQRKQAIASSLQQCSGLPGSIAGMARAFNKDVYYYGAQLNEYKTMLKDPAQAERAALTVLNKVPAFTAFMEKNSYLSKLFGAPDAPAAPEALAGLQTRDAVQKVIADRIGQAGPAGQAAIQDNIQAAQSELTKLKDKLRHYSTGDNNTTLPDFQPNSQKTKSFAHRITYGAGFQTLVSNHFYPSVVELTLNIGYKLSDKSTLVAGPSYLIGMGRDLQHVSLSLSGYGMHGSWDYKVFKSLWATAGAELNRWERSGKFTDTAIHALQKSLLIGISRKYSVGKAGEGSVQLLYNALWDRQTPKANMLEFRVGYSLK